MCLQDYMLACWTGFAFVHWLVFVPFYVGHMNPLSNGIYCGFMRVGVALSWAWLIYECATGNASKYRKRAPNAKKWWMSLEVLNSFFSWKGFKPLDRLCYCIYLIHLPVLLASYYSGEGRSPYTSTTTGVCRVCLDPL